MATIACPNCASPLQIPQPVPEKVVCPICQSLIKLSLPKGSKSAGGSSKPASTAPAGVATRPTPARPVPVAVKAPASQAKMVAGYELQRELARGGLGVVYLAFHPHLKHYRAIKRPQPRADLDSNVLLGRFRRETEALGTMESKNIVRAYDAGTDAAGPYLITEYLDGESLNNLVARHRQLPVSEACELIRQAALGLQTAHECGIVHRDIKPSNLMLTRATSGTARVVVIDWGLVKRTGEADAPANRLTTINVDLGTPDYIAPEQIRDARSVDIRADIYSLGATLYFLLAGKPPFFGRRDEAKLIAQGREEFPPLDQMRSDIPANLLAVLKKMVKKEPGQRFQTPGEVAVALQPFACAEPHRLVSLLAPVAPVEGAPNDTGRLLEPTQLAIPSQLPPPLAPSAIHPHPAGSSSGGGGKKLPLAWILGGVGGLLFLSLVIVLMTQGHNDKDPGTTDKDGTGAQNTKDKGTKNKSNDPSKATLPKVVIDEDFRDAYDKKLSIPEKWEQSDAFLVVKDDETGVYGLQVSKPAGVHYVKVPLPSSLGGNFSIAGAYTIYPDGGGQHFFSITLLNQQKNSLLPVVFYWNGKVSIADDLRNPPTDYKTIGSGTFLLKREGKKLRVFLNKELAFDKNLEEIAEYDAVRISLIGRVWGAKGRADRLYGLKIVALP